MNNLESFSTFTHANRKIEIHYDHDAESPRKTYDNLTTIDYWHRRLIVGDNKIEHETEEELRERVTDILAVLPVYCYQHSGVTISTTPFTCSFDSGQVGWAYITKSSAEEMGWIDELQTTVEEKRLHEAIVDEVKKYNNYLTGQVYGYIVKSLIDDEEIDSCWGFIGDVEYCISEAKSAAEHTDDPAVEYAAESLQERATLAWCPS